MADEADIAAEFTELSTTLALAAIRNAKYQGASSSYCVDCGNDIPEKRRLAVPGVKLCIICQELRERDR